MSVEKKVVDAGKKWLITTLISFGLPIIIGIAALGMFMLFFITVFAEDEVEINAYCSPSKEYDISAINRNFASYTVSSEHSGWYTVYPAGVLTDNQHLFFEYAKKYKVDAVLAMAIALEETKKGTTELVKNKNNVAPSFLGKNKKFKSLDKGIEALFKKLKDSKSKSKSKTILELSKVYSENNKVGKELIHEWSNEITLNILNLGGSVDDCNVSNNNNNGMPIILGEGENIIPTHNNFRVTSAFGYRIHPITKEKDFHSGIDLACTMASPILAFSDGIVTYVEDRPSGWSTTLGNYIIVQHSNGMSTWYGHLHPNTTLVKKGDNVVAGQQIGGCGTTGGSTGYHLDLKMRYGSDYLDPYPYLIGAKRME